jgi:hypothetical protein
MTLLASNKKIVDKLLKQIAFVKKELSEKKSKKFDKKVLE